MKRKNRISIKLFIIILLSFVFVTTVSYAWFSSEITLEGNMIETGSASYVAYGYNKLGDQVSTLANEGEQVSLSTDINEPLFSQANFTKGSSSTVYVSIKATGRLDLEYKLNFISRGYGSQDINFASLGGYWYRITDITSSVNSSLSGYVESNPTVTGSTKNMNIMSKDVVIGNIAGTSGQTKYYRLDFGVDSDAAATEYTTSQIEIFANVEVDLKNHTTQSSGTTKTHNISDATSLEKAVETANDGDTLSFQNNVEYIGDLIIKHSVNITMNNKTLTVRGNLIYSTSTSSNIKFSLIGAGTIKVLCLGQSGGNFKLDVPNSQVEIYGTTNETDMIVEKDFTISCAAEEGKNGCLISSAKIRDIYGEYKEITVQSNSFITINNNTIIGAIKADINSMNIKVDNKGTIYMVDMTKMISSNQCATPQIYISNYNVITTLALPSWSKKFVSGTKGTNTKVINLYGASITTLNSGSNFKNTDIEVNASNVFVESVDGTDTNLRVHYKNNGSTTTKLQGLLEQYFTTKGKTVSEVGNILRLEIDCINAKVLTANDEYYLRTKLTKLQILDLEDANLENNKAKANAFQISTLKEFILPKNLEVMELNTTGNVTLQYLTIPESVTNIAYRGLERIKYAIFESINPPKVTPSSGGTVNVGCRHNFVPPEAIDAYLVAFNTSIPDGAHTAIEKVVYPHAILADDGANFVRAIDDGNYEIVLCDLANNTSIIKNNKYTVGENITINGQPIVITQIGKYAFRDGSTSTSVDNVGFRYNNYDIKLADTITTIDEGGLQYGYFKSLDLNEVTNIGYQGCMRVTVTNELNLGKLKNINGDFAFSQASASIINGENVDYVGYACFHYSRAVRINLPNATYLDDNAVVHSSTLVEINIPKVEYIGGVGLAQSKKLISIDLPSIKKLANTAFVTYNSALVSMRIGPNLASSTTYLPDCPNLRQIFLECEVYVDFTGISTKANTVSGTDYDLLLSSDVNKTMQIFVPESLYSTYYANTHSTLKENVRIIGDKTYGDYNKTSVVDNENVGTYNLGQFTIKDQTDGYIITAYNVLNEDAPTSLEIPKTMTIDGVTKQVIGISKYAFKNKNVNVTTLNNVKTIGDYAFTNSDGLVNLDAPSLESAGTYAFNDCNSLKTINIPKLNHWSDYLFNNCPALEVISTACKFTSVATAINGTTKNIKKIIIDYECASASDLPTTTVFEGLKSKCANVVLYVPVRSLSLYQANSTFNALLPESIEIKVTDANNNSYYLKEFNFDGVASYLITYVVSSSTTAILPATYSSKNIVGSSNNAFDGTTFTTLTIPANYKFVNEGEFANVNGLKSIEVNSSNTAFTAVDGVLYTKDMSELVAFPRAKESTSYSISSSLKGIRSKAFMNVSVLTTLTLNSGLLYIDNDAFLNSSIKTYVFQGTTAPYILGTNTFDRATSIKVPSSAVTTYKQTNGFRPYENIISQ